MERRRLPSFRELFQFALATVAVIATLFATYSQYTSAKTQKLTAEESAYRVSEMANEVKAMEERLANLEATLARGSSIGTGPSGSETPADIQRLAIRVDQIEESTKGLRQAVNPIAPEEVLTIARLTDRVADLKEDFEQLDKSVERELGSFRESVQRELQNSTSSTNLILVVLVPLVLNFLYTVWKDLRTKSESKEERK